MQRVIRVLILGKLVKILLSIIKVKPKLKKFALDREKKLVTLFD